MSQAKGPVKVTSRNEPFAERAATRIWEEIPSKENPYIAESCRCHGYDLLALMQKRSYVDVLYLLFRGELPSTDEAQLLERLMIALINPGPRDPATRAAMNAGVGKTDPAHILPIGLMIHGGKAIGASQIEGAMRFLRKNKSQSPKQCMQTLMASIDQSDGDRYIAPGFGSHYGGIDVMTNMIAHELMTLPASGEALKWGYEFAQALNRHQMGWLATGLAAAVLTDLGFQPRAAMGLFQLMAAPGLLAHGIELSNKPRTAMPYVSDENYIIEDGSEDEHGR